VQIALSIRATPEKTPAKQRAKRHQLEVVKHTEAKKGFVLLPRRVVERTFGWLGRFRRLTRDYERLAEVLAVALACLPVLLIKQVGFQSQ